MTDYVECQECGIAKSKEVTFLEIHLPIRSFGNTNAYECIVRSIFYIYVTFNLSKIKFIKHLVRSFATAH